jgi:hypothetical protein
MMVENYKTWFGRIWLLKEGAVIGLIVGLIVYYLKFNLFLGRMQAWFGPLNESQLLITTLFVCVSLGIIIDAIYKPNK